MEKPKHETPSAFPETGHEAYAGMNLRDYFAAKALEGIGVWSPTIPGDHIARAVWAYSAADAMMAVRLKENAQDQ